MKRILFIILLFMSNMVFAADFTAKTVGDYGNVTVLEVTGNYDTKNADGTLNSVPRETIAKEFLKTHKDEYDFIVIFTNFDFQMPDADAKAFYMGVKNDTKGIGQPLFDNSSFFGSNGKLQGVVDMGNIATLVTNPLDPNFEETLSLLAHEQMHRWGAYAKYKDANGNISAALLGKDSSHWSFLFDTQASILYGNKWKDNGDGTFTSTASRKYYSPLDLYLMGLHEKTKVPPMLLINNPDIDPARMPQAGATINGTPTFITIDDVIAAEGERIPGVGESQKTFKTAFILITTPGTFTGYEAYEIENIRNGWVTRFSILTDGKALTQIVLSPIEDLPTNPGGTPPPVIPRTLPPDIEHGVRWLMDNQKTDGSWMDLNQTAGRDTAEAVYVLKNFEIAGQSHSLGLNWLTGNNSENTDYLTRKINALAGLGQDVTALLNDLVLRRNADGGWGISKEYASNPLDTALVLKALSKAGYSEQAVIAKAVEYLKSKQNSDGGWGSDDAGNAIEPTANVLSAFNRYRSTYQLEDCISKGITWLSQRQNPDGGFGPSTGSGQGTSTIYDTALSVMTLRESSVSADITNNGINYLLNLQAENGSWYESPYQTALAVNAVWKATIDPDLSVKTEDITFIPAIITSLPTNVVMNANIWNLGRTDVPQAKVTLYKDAVAEANKIGEQVLAFPGQSSVTVTFFVTIPDGNEHRFYVSVDAGNLVKESNETNNTALNILKPQATYDFEILPSDVTVSQNPVDIFQDVTITSKITNKGTMNAYNVQLKYYIDEAGTPFDIATKTLDIPANSTISDEVTWHTNKAGENLPVTVFADSNNSFAEISEENNKAVLNLTVNATTEANLTISYEDILIAPNPSNEGGNSTISALVKNEGFSPVGSFAVNFYKGDPADGGVLLGTKTVSSLNAGENITVSFDWINIPESGERVIYVKVDPGNLISEISEYDNDAFTVLNILSLPDLAVSTNSITFTPPAPKEGDTVLINVMVQNRGEQSLSNVTVNAYEGAALIGSKPVATIAGNSQAGVSFNYDTTGKEGAHKITAVVDPGNEITERSEDNNSAARTFGVQDANLWLSEQYISPNGDGVKDGTEFFFRLATAQTVKVLVVNGKDETVRTFSGSEFENTSVGNVTWDGLNDEGMVVDDGQYQIKVLDLNNNVVSSLLIVVDNNRSPLMDAIGTKYMTNTNIRGNIPYMLSHKWLPDESGMLFYIEQYQTPRTGEETPDFPTGYYIMSPDGQDISRLTPREWDGALDPLYNYSIGEFQLSPDGEKIALLLYKGFKNRNAYGTDGFVDYHQLWIIDRYGNNLSLIVSSEIKYKYQCYNYWCDTEIFSRDPSISNISWSPDGENLLYTLSNELWLLQVENNEKRKVDTIPENRTSEILVSPDSTQTALAWVNDQNNWVVRVTDMFGNNKDIFSFSNKIYNFNMEWFNDSKILLVEIEWTGGPARWRLWLLDATGNGNHFKIAEVTGPNWFEGPFKSPDGKSFAYYTTDSYTSTSYLNIHDESGNDYVLYSLNGCDYYKDDSCVRFTGVEPVFDEITWSPDSKKVALFAWNLLSEKYVYSGGYSYYEHDGPYLVALDVKTREETSVDLSHQPHRDYIIKWLSDNVSFLGQNTGLKKAGIYYHELYVADSKTGEMVTLMTNEGSSAGDYDVSPFEHYIMRQHWVIGFLHNLVANLRVRQDKSSVLLRGVAADLHFEGDKLEYANLNTPNTWNLIAPPSDVPVINDIFTIWVPPSEGKFYIRLTVWDKAGNVATSRKIISWGDSSVITNLYKSREIFSPNGDAVKDTVGLHYSALEPVHLEFNIYDEGDKLIMTFLKDHAGPVDDLITWDGRDSGGQIVPDGKYKIKVFDFEFFVEVDNTPPDVRLTFIGLTRENGLIEKQADLEGHAVDVNLKGWSIEYGEGNNPGEWNEYLTGDDQLVARDDNGAPLMNPLVDEAIETFNGQDLQWLINKKFRITAEDFAGNKSALVTDFVPEEIVIYKWTDISVFFNPEIIECGGTTEITLSLFEWADVIETIKAEIALLVIQYEKGGVWSDLKTISYPLSEAVQISLSSLQYDFNGTYPIRVKAVDVFSNEFLTNEVVLNLPFLGKGIVPVRCPDPENILNLSVSYIENGCDSLSNQALLSVTLKGRSNVSLKTLSYYIGCSPLRNKKIIHNEGLNKY